MHNYMSSPHQKASCGGRFLSPLDGQTHGRALGPSETTAGDLDLTRGLLRDHPSTFVGPLGGEKRRSSNLKQPILGIDVSHHNGPIDWKAVAAGGVRFAYLKATEGTSYLDPCFVRNREAASAARIRVGAYHFLRPDQDATAQAEHFLSTIGEVREGDLAPVLDVEAVRADDGHDLWKDLSLATRVLKLGRWIAKVGASTGQTTALYLSPGWWGSMFPAGQVSTVIQNLKRQGIPLPKLYDRPLWVAHYDVPRPAVPPAWKIYQVWQSTDHGTVPGIQGPVDLDYWNPDVTF